METPEFTGYLKELGDRASFLAEFQARRDARKEVLEVALEVIKLQTEQRNLQHQQISNLEQQITILRDEVQTLSRIVEQVDVRVEKQLDHLPSLDS